MDRLALVSAGAFTATKAFFFHSTDRMKNKNKRGAKTGLCSFLRGVKRVSTKTTITGNTAG